MRLNPLAGLAVAILLAGCGGGSSNSASATTSTVVVTTPTPTPVASPAPAQAAAVPADCMAPRNSFAGFDFRDGTAYPATAEVAVQPATYNAQSGIVNVPVTLDRPTAMTVIVRTGTINGTGLSGIDYTAVAPVVIFRPGDPERQTISIPVLRYREGVQFTLKIQDVQGATLGTASATITAGATATDPATDCRRSARTFQPSGRLIYALNRNGFASTDEGSDTSWATSLSYGRERKANEETGLYVDSKLAAFSMLAPTHYWSDEGLVIRSDAFAVPIEYNGTSYSQGAVILDGRELKTARVTYGQYEWTAKMPDRAGSWPALWLKATTGWPPEIDVYEGFNYRNWWQADHFISSTIHGGSGGQRTFMNGIVNDASAVFGISGLTSGFHRYAIDVQPDYITWFLDGREVNQVVNPFVGKTWYPIMDVAVRTTAAYAGNSGEMTISDFKVYSQ